MKTGNKEINLSNSENNFVGTSAPKINKRVCVYSKLAVRLLCYNIDVLE